MGKEVTGKENEMAQEKERPAGSQSLFRGLMLIEILSNYPNGCPLAHLSELAGLNKSTVHRLLQGLQSCGYVTTAPAAGSYRLTTKFIAVGQKALSSLNIIHIAAPHLEALNIATGETINFSSREDDHAILIYKLEPTTGMLRTRAYIGQHMPLYCSAMGKIYMAFGHPDYVKSYWESHQHEIQPLTRNTITELPAMFDELKPQTMEISMPSKDNIENEETAVQQSRAITLILGKDNKVFYYFGQPDFKDYTSLKETTYQVDGLRAGLLGRNQLVTQKIKELKQKKQDLQISEEEYKRQAAEIKKDKSSPIVMIKATDDANYKNLIDALDEMQICNISKYAIVDLAEADEYLMKNLESAGDYSKKFDVDSKSTTH